MGLDAFRVTKARLALLVRGVDCTITVIIDSVVALGVARGIGLVALTVRAVGVIRPDPPVAIVVDPVVAKGALLISENPKADAELLHRPVKGERSEGVGALNGDVADRKVPSSDGRYEAVYLNLECGGV